MPLHKVMTLLSYAEKESTFFDRILRFHSKFSREYRLIERAYDDAQNAFVEVYREKGEPYFTHVRAVAILLIEYLFIFERRDLKIAPHEIVAATLIHDNVEDRPDVWTLDRIARDYSREMALILDYVSKRPKSHFDGDKEKQAAFYHSRFATAPLEFFMVKLPDRLHNQITIWDRPEEKIRYKMWETQQFYLPFARQYGILAHELEETLVQLQKKYPIR
jgi:GTP pyrophosphokinase/guanosine-3',5'-bis(diphosphate) 3'-pyrophosphohydrolase